MRNCSDRVCRRWLAPLGALLIAGAGCASEPAMRDGQRESRSASVVTSESRPASRGAGGTTTSEWTATTSRAARAESAKPAPVAVSETASSGVSGDYGISRALASGGDDFAYFSHLIISMSDPFFEGRSADTRGGELSTEYLEYHMRDIGLEPAFPEAEISPGGAETAALRSYGQDFSVNGPLEVRRAEASYQGDAGAVTLEAGEDFQPMGFSATRSVTAPLAFVGYSVEEGGDGYATYGAGDDLTGRIAVMLRYEPMDGSGGSQWASRGWSGAASLTNKMRAAAERGAAGVILVNPPRLDVADVNRLQSPSRSRFRVDADFPVVQMTPKAANTLVKLADPRGRNLMELQSAADDGGGVTMFDDGVLMTMDVDLERKQLGTANVGGILRGKGSLADEWVIIGAHYDHVGYGHLGGARGGSIGELHPGADDNASGTAGVLILGKRMKAMYDALDAGADARSVLFLCFAGEEMGLLGSAHFVDVTDMDPSKVQAMLNMDMIGRLTDNKLEISGTGTGGEWDAILEPIIRRSGMDVSKSLRTGGRSDHANFARWGAPAVHFFTGVHNDYHTPRDTIETINYEGAMRVVDFVGEVAGDLATRRDLMTRAGESAPASSAAAEEPERPTRMSFNVRLGIRPEMYEGGDPGVLVGEVYPDTSAAGGGMMKGDRIVRWDGHDIADVMGMMERLGSHNPGDIAKIVVVRAGKEVELTVPMKAPAGAS